MATAPFEPLNPADFRILLQTPGARVNEPATCFKRRRSRPIVANESELAAMNQAERARPLWPAATRKPFARAPIKRAPRSDGAPLSRPGAPNHQATSQTPAPDGSKRPFALYNSGSERCSHLNMRGRAASAKRNGPPASLERGRSSCTAGIGADQLIEVGGNAIGWRQPIIKSAPIKPGRLFCPLGLSGSIANDRAGALINSKSNSNSKLELELKLELGRREAALGTWSEAGRSGIFHALWLPRPSGQLLAANSKHAHRRLLNSFGFLQRAAPA